MSLIKVLELVGLNDMNQVRIVSNPGRFMYKLTDSLSLKNVLNPKKYHVVQYLIGGVTFEMKPIPAADIIHNSIGKPEACTRALGIARKISSRLNKPIINNPEEICRMARDSLFYRLKEIEGIIIPKIIKIRPKKIKDVEESLSAEGVLYPFIVEEVAGYEDNKKILIRGRHEIAKLNQSAFDGREYYISEYIDYRSIDGYYRKYRYYVVNGKIFPSYLIISDTWDVKQGVKKYKEHQDISKKIKDEERLFLKHYKKKGIKWIKNIDKHLSLDYYAIDCGYDRNKRPVLFGIECSVPYYSTDKDKDYYDRDIMIKINNEFSRLVESINQR